MLPPPLGFDLDKHVRVSHGIFYLGVENQSLVRNTVCVEYTVPRGVWGIPPQEMRFTCRSSEVASEGWSE